VRQSSFSANGLLTHYPDGPRIVEIVHSLSCGHCAQPGELQAARGGTIESIMARARASVGIDVASPGSAPQAHFECGGNTAGHPTGTPRASDSLLREYRWNPPVPFGGGAVRARLHAEASLTARLDLDNSNDRVLGPPHGGCDQPPVHSACANGESSAECEFGLENLNCVAGSLEFTLLMDTAAGALRRRSHAHERSGNFCTGAGTTSTTWGGSVSIRNLSLGVEHSYTRPIGGTRYSSSTSAKMKVECYLCLQLPSQPSAFAIRMGRGILAQAAIQAGRFAEAEARVIHERLEVVVESNCGACSEPPYATPGPDSMGGS
jgi:hypothetical protein